METNFQTEFPATPMLEGAVRIVRRLREDGHVAYFVGGCVRDAVLGVEVQDYDIATSAPPARVESLFRHTIPVGAAFGVMMVVIDSIPFEVATFRSESGYANRRHPSNVDFSTPEEDVKRRDFTINGLFYDPLASNGAGGGIDFVDGVADIRSKTLRTIGSPGDRFDEDALRLMRAARFAATYGLEIEAETWRAMADRAGHMEGISPERIGEEWTKGLLNSLPSHYIRLMMESGLAEQTMPPLKAVEGYTAAGVDVIDATKRRLDHLANPPMTWELPAIPASHYADYDPKINSLHDVQEQKIAALFACLFLELGRPAGTKRREQGIWRGAAMTSAAANMWRGIARSLALSNKRRDIVATRLERADEWQMFDQLSLARRRTLLGAPEAAIDLALLEGFSTVYETSRLPLDAARELAEKFESRDEALLPTPLVTGGDLIQRLGVQPGPILGEILDELRRRQLDDQIHTLDKALEAACELLEKST